MMLLKSKHTTRISTFQYLRPVMVNPFDANGLGPRNEQNRMVSFTLNKCPKT